MNRQESIKKAIYVGNILLAKPQVIMSWGVSKVHVVEGGLQFHTQGFLHTGTVKVIHNGNKLSHPVSQKSFGTICETTDLFDVTFQKDDSPTEKETCEGIRLDMLVDFLDRHIEYTGQDYETRVAEEYRLPRD